MKIRTVIISFILFIALLNNSSAQVNVEKEFEFIVKQYEGMIKTHPDLNKFPQSTHMDGSPNDRTSDWWCSGFFGGALWYIYEYTKDEKWKNRAHEWTMAVEKEKNNTSTHDLGFMLYCSFGNGYRLTENDKYKEIMLVGAKSLSTRFNPKVGLIKSWDKFQNKYTYPVIIDNMMNLEFLFWASKNSGNKDFYNLSITHADKTLKHQFRKDYSCYHVICYDENGKVIAKKTHQGASDNSAWARGQGWALYGYTMMYRETKKKKYLKQAEAVAEFIINHPNLPKDKVPYWDFDAPNIPNEERDASSAAIYASALLELSQYSTKSSNKYFDFAEQTLKSLALTPYKAQLGKNNYFILTQSVGHKPDRSEVNTPIIYADYYYLEALLRYDKLIKQKSIKP